MNLQDTIFQYYLRHQPKREVVMRTWETVRTVAVLYDCGDEATIIKQLSAQDKHIDFFGIPNKQDIHWLTHKPSKKALQHIREYHYDLLLDLTQEPSIALQYMVMYMRADFKVGRHVGEGIHDMTIDTPAKDTPYYLLEQILRYIHIFTSQQS